MMHAIHSQQVTVVRTDRGLSIAGTRTTLYNVLDYLNAGFPRWLIQERLNLTETQMQDVIEYIGSHQTEVETEYYTILQQAEENRKYWEARNRERFAHLATKPSKPGHEAIRAKLQAWKASLK